MFTNLYNTIFRERINDLSAEHHNNDSEWFDLHYDELKAWCDNID
jgi:hypothetical protein